MSSTPWRNDPALAGRFHPAYPDDLQVIVHDGEPRRTQRQAEACWVSLRALHSVIRRPLAPTDVPPPAPARSIRWSERPIYAGVLLNDPHHLTTVRRGDTILIVVSAGLPHPLQVTERYLAERSAWSITPCDRCGAEETVDPPTVMAATRFPAAPEGSTPISFTAFCPCGGTLLLARIDEGAAR